MRDALESLEAATVGTPGGERVSRSVAGWTAPTRVAVAGRPGVGKSAVVAALVQVGGTPITEVHGVDSPEVADARLDADLLLYLIVRVAHPADLVALAGRSPADTVLVLAKADALADRDAAVAAAHGSTSLPVVSIDTRDDTEVATLRGAAEDAFARVSGRRTQVLLAELESTAAAEPSVREAVESFLRHRPRT